MELLSPKDGFVIDLMVNIGASVKLGDIVAVMDTEDEDRRYLRVQKSESARAIMARRFEPDETKRKRRIAEIAVDIAREDLKVKKGKNTVVRARSH